ncbi:hypothetical protein O181_068112 [Austropuccinia psidii MF-1]|uniref:Uncharacterized protein n=1 Tax=Austropuccinia psidii MF-1 TaxID=1389203 RepID=A0A9Q3EYP5_9BASI|nr:hypothetical protein [Austropuccinia psidii MF-1]
MCSWHILKKVHKEEEILKYSNRWNQLESNPQIKNIKDWHNKKGEESKIEAPIASTSKPQASQPPQEGKKKKKNNFGTTFPKLQDPKKSKEYHGKCLQHVQNLDGIKGKRGTKNYTSPFPKEITFSPYVSNTLTEIKNSLLPLK